MNAIKRVYIYKQCGVAVENMGLACNQKVTGLTPSLATAIAFLIRTRTYSLYSYANDKYDKGSSMGFLGKGILLNKYKA